MVMYLFSSIVLAGVRREHLGEPLSKWRCVFKFPICWCLRLQLFLVKGRPVSKAEAPILVCNHVSPFEPLALISITHGTPVQRSEDAKRVERLHIEAVTLSTATCSCKLAVYSHVAEHSCVQHSTVKPLAMS
eukprot:15178-Heterococcus_DN1.PRE.6